MNTGFTGLSSEMPVNPESNEGQINGLYYYISKFLR